MAALRRHAEERGLAWFEISSITGLGIEALKFAMAERLLGAAPAAAGPAGEAVE